MTDKLQKAYYIVGLIQKITMVAFTFCMLGALYKLYTVAILYATKLEQIIALAEKLYRLLDKSWFF